MAVTVDEIIPARNMRNAEHVYVLTSTKFKAKYTVKLTVGGFAFWEITVDVGTLPAALSGFHTTANAAIQKFKEWEAVQSKSKAVRTEENRKEREARKVS